MAHLLQGRGVDGGQVTELESPDCPGEAPHGCPAPRGQPVSAVHTFLV